MSEDNEKSIESLKAELDKVHEELRNVKRSLMAAEKLRHSHVSLGSKTQGQGSVHNEALLASGIAHEFNNILGAADGHAEWALDSGRPEDMKDALEIVRMACARSLQITRGLQGIQGPQEEEAGLFSMSKLWQEIERDTQPLQQKFAISLNAKVSDYEIYGNSGRLYEVLLNLLKNSVEALSSQQGTESDREIRVLGKVDGDVYIILFADNGPGVPQIMADQIFAPFFTTKGQMAHVHMADGVNQGQGSGLGLYLCRKILSEMGGGLELLSVQQAEEDWSGLKDNFEGAFEPATVFKILIPHAESLTP